jgi:hypothetical protein
MHARCDRSSSAADVTAAEHQLAASGQHRPGSQVQGLGLGLGDEESVDRIVMVQY